ncbi:MAG: hypothetical protein AAB410_03085 [Patescibacteria group bacterium]
MNKYHDFEYELDDYEKEVLKGLAKEGYESVPDAKKQMDRLRAAAKATLEKNRNVNIRISESDLFKVKSRASEQGIPYQTLLTSLIHQYSRGQIDYNVLRHPKKG